MSTRLPTLYYVPIEPFPGRYTEQWYTNFPETFNEFSLENKSLPPTQALFSRVRVIEPKTLSQEIRHGTFLDMSSTLYAKAQQQARFAELLNQSEIEDGDVFFFGDLEFWGIEGWRLALDVCGLKNCKIAGFLHAASFTHGDAFEVAAPYQRFTEVGWFQAVDRIYVGSEYAKDAFIARRLDRHLDLVSSIDKILPVSNPMWLKDYPCSYVELAPRSLALSVFKPNPTLPRVPRQVVFPNRFDSEKCARESLELARAIVAKDPSVTCVFTTSHSAMRSNDKTALAALNDAADAGEVKLLTRLTKGEYHQVLATSEVMVTLSTEENFGYCVAESLMYGAVPLMTPGLSHAEFLPPKPAFFFEGWGRGVLLTEELKLKYAQQVIDMLDTVSKTPDAIPIVSAYVNLGITQDNAGFAEKIALSLCAPRRIASDLAKLP